MKNTRIRTVDYKKTAPDKHELKSRYSLYRYTRPLKGRATQGLTLTPRQAARDACFLHTEIEISVDNAACSFRHGKMNIEHQIANLISRINQCSVLAEYSALSVEDCRELQ